jgi:hypothetical protein
LTAGEKRHFEEDHVRRAAELMLLYRVPKPFQPRSQYSVEFFPSESRFTHLNGLLTNVLIQIFLHNGVSSKKFQINLQHLYRLYGLILVSLFRLHTKYLNFVKIHLEIVSGNL